MYEIVYIYIYCMRLCVSYHLNSAYDFYSFMVAVLFHSRYISFGNHLCFQKIVPLSRPFERSAVLSFGINIVLDCLVSLCGHATEGNLPRNLTDPCTHPLNTWRNYNVVITSKRRYFDVITSKWRSFDVITTSLLNDVSCGCTPTRKHLVVLKEKMFMHFITVNITLIRPNPRLIEDHGKRWVMEDPD